MADVPSNLSWQPAFPRRSPPLALPMSAQNQAPERKVLECPRCFKQIMGASNLMAHLRTHTGEKPFTCDICLKDFSQRGNLIMHKRLHTGERPFKCEECGRAFTQKGNLKAHMRCHTGETPYECQYCPARFSQHSGLKSHLRNHYNELEQIIQQQHQHKQQGSLVVTEVTKLLTHPPQNPAEELQRRLVISALQQHQFPPQLGLGQLSNSQSSDIDNNTQDTQNLIEKSLSIVIETRGGNGGEEDKQRDHDDEAEEDKSESDADPDADEDLDPSEEPSDPRSRRHDSPSPLGSPEDIREKRQLDEDDASQIHKKFRGANRISTSPPNEESESFKNVESRDAPSSHESPRKDNADSTSSQDYAIPLVVSKSPPNSLLDFINHNGTKRVKSEPEFSTSQLLGYPSELFAASFATDVSIDMFRSSLCLARSMIRAYGPSRAGDLKELAIHEEWLTVWAYTTPKLRRRVLNRIIELSYIVTK